MFAPEQLGPDSYSIEQGYNSGTDSDSVALLSDSSEDDTYDVKSGKFSNSKRKGREASEDDEFEQEMSAELDSTLALLQSRYSQKSGPNISGVVCSNKSTAPINNKQNKSAAKIDLYDTVYFDSDSDDDKDHEVTVRAMAEATDTAGNTNNARRVLSDDELLYDPNNDEENEKWAQQQRDKNYRGVSKMAAAAANSDAVLNCPGCMTLLCVDCQRHSSYKNQYRAMFVENCQVDNSKFLSYPETKKRSKQRKWQQVCNDPAGSEAGRVNDPAGSEAGRVNDPAVSEAGRVNDPAVSEAGGVNDPAGSEADGQKYNPVECEVCRTQVAVYDHDEVYHFFNVLASY